MTDTANDGPKKGHSQIAPGEYTAPQPANFKGYECITEGCHQSVPKPGDECILCMHD